MTGRRTEFTIACNWKAFLEVFNEYYHLRAVQGRTIAGIYGAPEPGDQVASTYASKFAPHTDDISADVLDGGREASMPVMAGLEGAARTGTRYSWVFPNMAFAASTDAMWMLEAYPLTAGTTRGALSVCFPKSSTLLPDYQDKANAYFKRMETAMAEDMAILEQQQLGLASPLAAPGRFAPILEDSVHAFQSWLAARMLAADNRA